MSFVLNTFKKTELGAIYGHKKKTTCSFWDKNISSARFISTHKMHLILRAKAQSHIIVNMKHLQNVFHDGMSHKSPESLVASSYLQIQNKNVKHHRDDGLSDILK